MTQPRIALVTGGARRVGRAISIELARAGCDIALHYSSSSSDARNTASDIRALGRRCVLMPLDFNQALEEHGVDAYIQRVVGGLGGLDILVNNASMFEVEGKSDPEAFDLEIWSRMFKVNAFAPAALSLAGAAVMRSRGKGCIVNLCDISAERPWANHLAYCASKAALVCLTRGMARALAPEVRVNAVSPGIAAFPESYGECTRASLIERVPLARAGKPEDVAKAVRFLVDAADYVTGQVIAVDGGRSCV